MSSRPVNKMSDQDLAAEHAEMQEASEDMTQPGAPRAARRCLECEREIERRRKGKEWAANYFGESRNSPHAGRPPQQKET